MRNLRAIIHNGKRLAVFQLTDNNSGFVLGMLNTLGIHTLDGIEPGVIYALDRRRNPFVVENYDTIVYHTEGLTPSEMYTIWQEGNAIEYSLPGADDAYVGKVTAEHLDMTSVQTAMDSYAERLAKLATEYDSKLGVYFGNSEAMQHMYGVYVSSYEALDRMLASDVVGYLYIGDNNVDTLVEKLSSRSTYGIYALSLWNIDSRIDNPALNEWLEQRHKSLPVYNYSVATETQ